MTVRIVDPLFDDEGAAAMVDLCRRFGRYRLYAEHDQHDVDLGRGLAPRHDSVRNYVRQQRAAGAAMGDVVARTSYFREEYAYGSTSLIDGIDAFLENPHFVDAAREVHGLPVVVPAIAYANLYLPGQQLAVHTDVPEFRGANRKAFPQWLLVVMRHSGLFEEWRLPIVTAIAYFHDTPGGALVYWPDGAGGPAMRYAPRANSAIVLDTDTVFHGVEVVGDEPTTVPPLAMGAALFAVDDGWVLRDAGGEELARYAAGAPRFSVSWKAYVFPDEAAVTRWREHTDDLTFDVVLERLLDDLRRRGRIGADDVPDRAMGLTAIDEYVHFPP